jgi:hypothetical protein
MKNGDEIPYLQGRESNRFIWDVENKLGLVTWRKDNGKNTKLYKGFDRDTTAKIVEGLREDYVGNFTIKYIAPDTKGDFGIKISGYPVSKEEVDRFIAETSPVERNEAVQKFIEYEEFEQRRRDANEDIIPLDQYEQRNILYDNHTLITSEAERFSKQQIEELKATLQATMPMVEEIIEDRNITVNGVIEAGGKVIRINPDTMTKSTIGHEFGHLFIDLRGGLSNPFIQKALEQLKDTDLAKKVREAYADKTEEQIQKEILSEAIGTEVADIFESESERNEFAKWLLRFFRWLGSRLGISKNHVRELAREMLAGKPLDSSKYTGKPSEITQEQRDLVEEGEDITPEEVGGKMEVDDIPTDLEEIIEEHKRIRAKASDLMEAALERARRNNRVQDIGELTSLYNKMLDVETSDAHAIYQFVDNASKTIHSIYKTYTSKLAEERRGKTDTFTIKLMARWNDVMTGFDLLDEIESVLSATVTKGVSKTDLRQIKSVLANLISKKNEIKQEYQLRGKAMAIAKLEAYTNQVIVEERRAKVKEWLEKNADKKMKMSERLDKAEEYAEQWLKDNIIDLNKEIKTKLRAAMDVAASDVSWTARWLDTMLNTNDMVFGAAIKKFVSKNREARRKSIEFKDRAWPLVKELYRESGYTYLKTPPHKVYDYMLEKIDGKRTGNIISKFSSELMEEYKKFKDATEHLPDAERYAKRSNWKEENMPLDKKRFKEDRNTYLDSLVEDGIMSEEEKQLYLTNLQRPFRNRFLEKHIMNSEAADAIKLWVISNSMEYRNPTDKWVNPEWAKFEEFINNNPESTKAKFYKLIKEEITRINTLLPYSRKRFSQLPFRYKSEGERVAAGQSIKEIGKEAYERTMTQRLDDIDKGVYTDAADKPVDYLPWFYDRPSGTHEHIVTYKLKVTEAKVKKAGRRAEKFKTFKRSIIADSAEAAIEKLKRSVVDVDEASIKVTHKKSIEWTDKDQSYDLMGLYFDYFRMANNYAAMSEIQPEMELVMDIAKERDYVQRDMQGNIIQRITGNKPVTVKGHNAKVVDMAADFFKMHMYGQQKMDEGSFDVLGWKIDTAKALDTLGRYSSYTMLGFNVMAASANVSYGEAQQVLESFAGEYFTTKDLNKGSIKYATEVGGILKDIGEPVPTSMLGKLLERWDILNEYEGGNFRKNSKFARLMSTSALFFMSHAGEHFMQSRVMLAMLSRVKAYDKDGEHIGSMMDMYKVTEGGELKVDERVDLEKSNWNEEQQDMFGMKVKTVLSRLHGEYSDLGKNAVQRYAIGRLGIMFRKFIVPGVKRRFESERINPFLDDYTEGSHRAAGKFLKKAVFELKALGLSAFSENWKTMTRGEQANIKRAAGELLFAGGVALLASALTTLKGEADEDDKKFLAANATLAHRVASEMLFYINPIETMNILRTPAVSLTSIENIIKFTMQLFNPLDEYERGSWAGKPKIYKTMVNMTPLLKQIYKLKNIEDTLTYYTK